MNMSFRIESSPTSHGASLITPGACFRILATSETLRKHMTDCYWCDFLEYVCEGKLEGFAVRYTGKNVVLVQFRPTHLSATGHRYPVSVSVPSQFLVPSIASQDLTTSFAYRRPVSMADALSSLGTHPSELEENASQGAGNDLPKLCVVCGRFEVPEMIKRKSGWKCKDCKGTPSVDRLRQEATKLSSIL